MMRRAVLAASMLALAGCATLESLALSPAACGEIAGATKAAIKAALGDKAGGVAELGAAVWSAKCATRAPARMQPLWPG